MESASQSICQNAVNYPSPYWQVSNLPVLNQPLQPDRQYGVMNAPSFPTYPYPYLNDNALPPLPPGLLPFGAYSPLANTPGVPPPMCLTPTPTPPTPVGTGGSSGTLPAPPTPYSSIKPVRVAMEESRRRLLQPPNCSVTNDESAVRYHRQVILNRPPVTVNGKAIVLPEDEGLEMSAFKDSLWQMPITESDNKVATGIMYNAHTNQYYETFEDLPPPPNTNKGAIQPDQLKRIQPKLVALMGHNPHLPPRHKTELPADVWANGGGNPFGAQAYNEGIRKQILDRTARDLFNNRNGILPPETDQQLARPGPAANYFGLVPRTRPINFLQPKQNDLDLHGYMPFNVHQLDALDRRPMPVSRWNGIPEAKGREGSVYADTGTRVTPADAIHATQRQFSDAASPFYSGPVAGLNPQASYVTPVAREHVKATSEASGTPTPVIQAQITIPTAITWEGDGGIRQAIGGLREDGFTGLPQIAVTMAAPIAPVDRDTSTKVFTTETPVAPASITPFSSSSLPQPGSLISGVKVLPSEAPNSAALQPGVYGSVSHVANVDLPFTSRGLLTGTVGLPHSSVAEGPVAGVVAVRDSTKETIQAEHMGSVSSAVPQMLGVNPALTNNTPTREEVLGVTVTAPVTANINNPYIAAADPTIRQTQRDCDTSPPPVFLNVTAPSEAPRDQVQRYPQRSNRDDPGWYAPTHVQDFSGVGSVILDHKSAALDRCVRPAFLGPVTLPDLQSLSTARCDPAFIDCRPKMPETNAQLPNQIENPTPRGVTKGFF